jgi:hypothetical protein
MLTISSPSGYHVATIVKTIALEPGSGEMPTMHASTESTRGLYGQRPSKSADAARRREFAEIAAMTARERVILALSLKERLRFMCPTADRRRLEK